MCLFFLIALGLHCCPQAFSSYSNWERLLAVVHSLPTEVVSLVAERGLQQLPHTGSAVAAYGLGCPTACGILPEQESNLCVLQLQVDSYPLYHQGSPCSQIFKYMALEAVGEL